MSLKMQLKVPWLPQTNRQPNYQCYKDIPNKKQRPDSINTVAFINKTRNDPLEPEIIEERIE